MSSPGILNSDLYTIIKREKKLPSYKLDYVANEYIGDQKDPISALDLFNMSYQGTAKEVATIIHYCVKNIPSAVPFTATNALNEATIIALIIQLLPQTIPGVIMYYNQKMIKLDIVYISLLILIGSFFGVYLGTTLTLKNYISKRFLYRFLVITLLISAFYISYKYWNIPN